jgi:predicted AAA+ superfamily ATPase
MFQKEFVLEYFRKLFERIEKEKIVRRELKISLLPNKATVIAGPRRAGKTFLLFSILKEEKNVMYLDLEHSAFRRLSHEDFFEIINLFETYFGGKVEALLIDEVQKIEDWERLIRSLLDSGYKVVASGSSSKLLSREVATHLRGRALTYLLLPLSFREYLKFKEVEIKPLLSISEKVKIMKLLEELLEWGGYPEVVINWDKKEKILREYFETILQLDFIERFKIVNTFIARTIFEFVFQNFSKELSINKIANYVSSALGENVKNLVYDYMEKLPESLTIFWLKKFEKSVYKRKLKGKIYVCDLGLPNLLLVEKDWGKRMENLVFLELLRRNGNIFYWKDYQGREVDFVVREGLKIKQLIQVTYASSKDEVGKREINALIKASDLLKCENLLCITWDYENKLKVCNKTINFIPLWKWLLSDLSST